MRIFIPLALLVMLPLSALADFSYTVTDSFANTYNLDLNQTTLRQANGSLWLPAGALNGSATSTVVNSVSGQILDATVTGAATTPPGTFIQYYISNDDGANWFQVNPAFKYQFLKPGSQLRWRAYLSRSLLDYNPYLDSVTVAYTIKDDRPSNAGSTNSTTPITSVGNPMNLVCNALQVIGIGCNGSPTAGPQVASPLGALNQLLYNVFKNLFGGK